MYEEPNRAESLPLHLLYNKSTKSVKGVMVVMKDYYGREFQVGDWLRGVGFVPYGKVKKVSEDEIEIQDDGAGETEKVTQKDVKERGICLTEYTIIRRRHLTETIPDDFFTLSTPRKNAALPKYRGISYFEGLIGDLYSEAGKLWQEGKVHLEKIEGYLEAAKGYLKEFEDEEGFAEAMVSWFKQHM